ncbi:MAG: DegV family EDD domain-containing protein [Malacoplasma sp.]|nr:DegV family EDD domain-containing protein [Malacoplasma sp.]
MAKIGFIVDSACGIKNGDYENVYVLPLIVTIKDETGAIKEYHIDQDIEPIAIDKAIKNKKCDVKTSQASIGELAKAIESIQDQYDRIYVIPIHTKISSSYNTWNMIKEDYPKICLLPTTEFGVGVKWDLEHLIELAKKNELTDQVAMDYMANSYKHKAAILFVYDLTQLAKGGRISNFKAALAKLFKMKIVISADDKGLNFLDKSASATKCIAKSFEYLKERDPAFDPKNVIRLGFMHSATDPENKNVSEFIAAIKDELKEANYKEEECIMPNVLMAHTGGNMFAFYIEFK